MNSKLGLLVAVAVAVAVAALAATAFAASAQTSPRQHRPRQQQAVERFDNERPPLTVTRRSFLDPGPVVPVGSMSNYVTANTIFNRTPDQVFAKSKFGNELLPAPLEVSGRPQPVLVFESPRLDEY